MSFTVGIGIITYNRREIVSQTIDRVRAFTRQSGAAMVVADDGSSDGTGALLRDKQVPVITGLNMGIAWNKNRALFLLSQMLCCETVILLEDDTQPTRAGWEAEWIRGAMRWGHLNFAGDWMSEYFLSGVGTVTDPVCSHMVTAQCSVYSRAALTFGGYFDPRYKGYGHEHVDHSRRLVRVGYGGTDKQVDGQEQVRYYSIKSDLTVVSTQSFFDEAQAQHNLQVAHATMGEQHYRAPWRDETQMRQFRSETESAMSEGRERFRLTAAEEPGLAGRPVTRGLFARLFSRT
jgi:glycosyltransferase involved in cell wall biosynthesis